METEIIYLDHEEVERLFRQLKVSGNKYIVRDRAIILLAYYCGLRISEIGKLKMSDFNVQKREIKCRRIQNGKDNVLKIVDEEVYNALYKHYRSRIVEGGCDILFISQWQKEMSRVNIHKIFARYCAEAQIDDTKRHFQVLRYSRAVELINIGFNLEELTWWLGMTQNEKTTIFRLYYQVIQKDNNVYGKLEGETLQLNSQIPEGEC